MDGTRLDLAERATYPGAMAVSAEYAQTHLQELLDATEQEEQVEIARLNGFVVALIPTSSETAEAKAIVKGRSGLFGAMKGQIWMADNWDSPEENAEIAARHACYFMVHQQ